MATMNPHEVAFVESFIVKPRRERALELLANPKNRYKLTDKFHHHGLDYFITEHVRPILSRDQHALNIAEILKNMGAPAICHFIGGFHDGQEMDLISALNEVVGCGQGTVLSCISGHLAYFEGEIKERFLLVRK